MKIKIKSADAKFTIHLPMRVVVWVLKKNAQQNGTDPNFSSSKIVKELKAAKKNFGKLRIVEVHSANGDIVEITL